MEKIKQNVMKMETRLDKLMTFKGECFELNEFPVLKKRRVGYIRNKSLDLKFEER